MEYSRYQLDIFDKIRYTTSNICVEATAGSGKSTTILSALPLIPKFKKSIFLSFSNAIVDELKSRVPDYIQASTLHSLGCRMLLKWHPGARIDDNKWFSILAEQLKPHEKTKVNFKRCGKIAEVLNYARMTLTTPDARELSTMCDHYSLDYDDSIIEESIKYLNLSVQKRYLYKIDFTDMVYWPAIDTRVVNERYDYVFLDEAQDLNNSQRLFIERILKSNGRLIAVGDSRQSIYSFAGSNIDSFEKLQTRPNTIVLPLSISYRCAKNIVKKAKEVYPEIEAFEQNEEGVVRKGSVDEVGEGDMVLCRKTAPLIAVFFYLLRKNIKGAVRGKDIEKGLVELAEKVQSIDIETTQQLIDKEKERLTINLKALGFKNTLLHPKYIALSEKIEVIEVIMQCTQTASTLIETIQRIFQEDKDAVQLMTIHRSKGLESDRVFLIEKYNGDTTLPSPFAMKQWEHVQERNLEFVAYTRAKKELIFIDITE